MKKFLCLLLAIGIVNLVACGTKNVVDSEPEITNIERIFGEDVSSGVISDFSSLMKIIEFDQPTYTKISHKDYHYLAEYVEVVDDEKLKIKLADTAMFFELFCRIKEAYKIEDKVVQVSLCGENLDDKNDFSVNVVDDDVDKKFTDLKSGDYVATKIRISREGLIIKDIKKVTKKDLNYDAPIIKLARENIELQSNGKDILESITNKYTKNIEDKKIFDSNKEISEESNDSGKISFSGYKNDSTKDKGYFLGKNVKIASGKYLLGSVSKKVYINAPDYTIEKVNAGLCTYEVNNKRKNSFLFNVNLDDNNWQTLTRDRRSASSRDNFDRYLGLYTTLINVKKGEKVIKEFKFEFTGKPGIYENENYDAMCKIVIDSKNDVVVLFKDVTVDTSNNCNNIVFSDFKITEKKAYDGDYVVIWPNKINDDQMVMKPGNKYRFSLFSTIICEKGYRFDGEINEDSPEEVLVKFGPITVENDDNLSIIDTDKISHCQVININNNNNENYVNDVPYSDSFNYGDCMLAYALKKTNILNDKGDIVNVTYEFDGNKGQHKKMNYDCQLIIKDGNKIVARCFIANAWLQEK